MTQRPRTMSALDMMRPLLNDSQPNHVENDIGLQEKNERGHDPRVFYESSLRR
jgi:hypothetical protein